MATLLHDKYEQNKKIQTKYGKEYTINRVLVPAPEFDLALTLSNFNQALKRYQYFIKHIPHAYEEQEGAEGSYSVLAYTNDITDPEKPKRIFSQVAIISYRYPQVTQARALESACKTAVASIVKNKDPNCRLEYNPLY